MAKHAKAKPSTKSTKAKKLVLKASAALFSVRKADATLLTVTSYEITDQNNVVAPFETTNVGPNGTVTWYTSGPPGLHVTISLYRQPNTGGHSHGGGSAGTISPSSFTLGPNYPQGHVSIFRAPEACGLIRQVTAGGGQQVENFNNVLVSGLVALGPSTGVTLTGSTATHPSNHWGTPQLVAGVQALGHRFYQKFQKNIFVNDISLQTGGLFDHQASWSPPHQTHRDGRHVDMNWSSMTATERDFFKLTAEALGFKVELHPNPNHWHLIM